MLQKLVKENVYLFPYCYVNTGSFFLHDSGWGGMKTLQKREGRKDMITGRQIRPQPNGNEYGKHDEKVVLTLYINLRKVT